MAVPVALLRKSATTMVAKIGSLSGMKSQMDTESRQVTESLGTVLARQHILAGVHPHVTTKTASARETFLAIGAGV